MKTTYCIIARTNLWIACRDSKFNGKCSVILKSGLSLNEAQAELLSMFQAAYEVSYPNWGVVMHSNLGKSHCTRWMDGTYKYEYDSRSYYIEEEAEEL